MARPLRPGGRTVVLLFPDEAAIRTGGKPPRPGTRLRSPRGRVWLVDQVLRSGVDTYTVTFVAPRLDLASPLDLAGDLLERARDVISPRRRRRHYRARDYLE